MSLQLIEYPDKLQSTGRPIIFKLKDDSGTAKRIHIFTVQNKVGQSSTSTEYTIFPDIDTTDEFTFDIQDLVEDESGFALQPIDGAGIYPATGGVVLYSAIFTPYILNGDGLLVADTGNQYFTSIELGVRHAMNAMWQHLDAQNLDAYAIVDANSAGDNLVSNGTFDTDISGWTAGAGSWSHTAGGGGRLSGIIAGVGTGAVSQGLSLTTNTTYQVSVDIPLINGGTIDAAVVTLNGATKVSGDNAITVADGSGTLQSTWETGGTVSSASIELEITSFSGSTNMNFDNISVQPVERFGSPARWLTHAVSPKRVGSGESEYLGAYIDAEDAWVEAEITTLRDDGVSTTYYLPGNDAADHIRFDLGVGPANLNTWQAGIIDDDILQYTVQLFANALPSQFSDGDNGTFNANITGINGSGLSRVQNPAGMDNVLQIDGVSVNPFLGIFDLIEGDTSLSLLPNTDYLFSAEVYVGGADIPADLSLFLAQTGFTGAVNHIKKAWDVTVHSIGQWYTIYTVVSLDIDNIGKLKLSGAAPSRALNTDLEGLFIFVNNIKVRKQELQEVTGKCTFFLDNDCHEDTTRVHFLNRLGTFDSYTFKGSEVKRIKTKSTSFQKYLNRGFATQDRGTQIQAREGQEIVRCSSGPMRVAEKLWLEELLTSPEIYIQREGQYLPVTINDGTFEVVDPQKNLQRLTVELTYSNELVLQRN